MIKHKGKKGLVHPSFPPQGSPMPVSAGSQSMSPPQAPDNYPAMNTTGPGPDNYMQ